MTPAHIFSQINLSIFSRMPGGIGMFLWTHRMCGMVGILIKSKYLRSNVPHSVLLHASAPSWNINRLTTRRFSSGYKNSFLLMSRASSRSLVSLLHSLNGKGFFGMRGRSCNGSGCGCRMIWNSSGSIPSTGWIFCATRLYVHTVGFSSSGVSRIQDWYGFSVLSVT